MNDAISCYMTSSRRAEETLVLDAQRVAARSTVAPGSPRRSQGADALRFNFLLGPAAPGARRVGSL